MDRAELFVHGTNGNDFKFQEYTKLVDILLYTKKDGLNVNLVDIFDEKYYRKVESWKLLENYSSDT
jgi:hypothetical protein